jgi:hypothetical protein
LLRRSIAAESKFLKGGAGLGVAGKSAGYRRGRGLLLQAHAYSFMFRPLLTIAAGDFDGPPKAFDQPQAATRNRV